MAQPGRAMVAAMSSSRSGCSPPPMRGGLIVVPLPEPFVRSELTRKHFVGSLVDKVTRGPTDGLS